MLCSQRARLITELSLLRPGKGSKSKSRSERLERIRQRGDEYSCQDGGRQLASDSKLLIEGYSITKIAVELSLDSSGLRTFVGMVNTSLESSSNIRDFQSPSFVSGKSY